MHDVVHVQRWVIWVVVLWDCVGCFAVGFALGLAHRKRP